MLVKYKTVVYKDYRGDDEEVVEMLSDESVPCCGPLKDQLGDAVEFGENGEYSRTPTLALVHKWWCYDSVEHSYHPISFCPFCGARIRAEEARRVRRVEKRKTEVLTRESVTYDEVPG